MSRFRKFLGWGLGEFSPFAFVGGINMADGFYGNKPFQIVFGIGFFFFAAVYLLRPVKIYLNRPIQEATRGTREFTEAARMGSDKLILALFGMYFACTLTYLGHQVLQLVLKGH